MKKLKYILAFLPLISFAQYGGIKISKLPPADSIKLSALIPMAQDGRTQTVSAGQLVGVICDSCYNSHWAANGNDIYNTNSGNVGIGTSAPTNSLSVNGSADFSNQVYAVYINASQDITARHGIFGNASNAGYAIFYDASNTGFYSQFYPQTLSNNRGIFIPDTSGVIPMSIAGAISDNKGAVNWSNYNNGYVLTSDASGNATWQKITATNKFDFSGLPQYANNAAALTGGLTVGQIYVDNSWHITVVH